MSILNRRLVFGLTAGIGLVLILLLSAWAWPRVFQEQLIDAPEEEAVPSAQRDLPFQILIPAYLPRGFERENVEILNGLSGPSGQVMVQLVYSHPRGVTLTLSEWMPTVDETAGGLQTSGGNAQRCTCMCTDPTLCSTSMLMIDSGPVRIRGETSDPAILSSEHVKVILNTLAPASGLLTYTTLDDVPLSAGLPPAEEIPINDNGIQEVVLVASPGGYTPVHFSVQKGIPVRLVFRILGDVGCGNELYVQWGAQEIGFLSILNPSDNAVLEFTPEESGDFLFHCSHYIFQGVMTVVD
jgi:Cupredoxin-like domain